MGQIKNIKLHIVTDIKHKMLRSICGKQSSLSLLLRQSVPCLINNNNNNNNSIINNNNNNNNINTRDLHTSTPLEDARYYVNKQYPRKKHGRRDMKVRQEFCRQESRRDALRCLAKSDILPHAVKEKAAEDLKKLPLDGCIVRVRDRCVLTDRARSTVRKYKISRIQFRDYADDGLISGYTKSTW